ncbi:MAG: nitrogen fixation protein NifH [Candidatus Bathyarchaeia archaeon]
MRDWKSVLKADPTDWLLERENPSVRYFTLRDILGHSDKDPEVVRAKAAIRSYKTLSKIFERQKPEGYWESAEQPYHPKYKSTYWQIMILGQLGLDKGDERVRRACEYIFQFQLKDGGFTTFKEEGAKREYLWVRKRILERGKKPPPFKAWAEEKIREYEMSCLTGNVAAALIRLGYASDDRVKRALKWLVEVQNEDGGWLCPYWKAHIRDKHGCFMGTITPLDAFSELPAECRTPEIEAAIKRGVEFLLMHRLFKADHHQFRVIKEAWLKFSFPCFFYDILRGLSVVTKLGYVWDERIDDALEILLQKQNADGRWILESTPSGRMQTNLEQKEKPSKWITLNALRVMKRVYQNRD